MKKLYLIFFLFIILPWQASGLLAQVTIGMGEPPHPSAVLELKSPDKNKGFLGPRIKLLKGRKDQETIKDPADGLLVYNTEDVVISEEDSVKADMYYYWSKQAGEWVDFMGQLQLEKTINETITKWSVPQAAFFLLDGKDTYNGYTGVINLLKGVKMGDAKNIPLKESINYTEGKVSLKYDGAGNNSIVFESGVYYIAFAYEVVPYMFIPYSNYKNSSYFMDFPKAGNISLPFL